VNPADGGHGFRPSEPDADGGLAVDVAGPTARVRPAFGSTPVNVTLIPHCPLPPDMADRIMKVNAFTTLDLVDGGAEGHGFEEDAYAVVNVTSPREDPDHVSLQLELDNTELEHLRPHAETVRLSAQEAKTLAADLEKHAEKVEANGD
jgi:hypothetical protein